MNRMQLQICAVLLLLCSVSAFSSAAPSIIPLPQQMEVKEGSFRLTPKTVVVADSGAQSEAEKLAAALQPATGFKFAVSGKGIAKGAIDLDIDGTLHQKLGAEGYQLSVTRQGITLRAATEAGLFYGGRTLLQLLPPEILASNKVSGVEWEIPCVEITDSPRFSWRGVMVDVSRHFLTVEELKKFMDVMALHKLNTLHLHLADDQGWRLEIRKYPRLTELGSVRRESPRPDASNHGDGKPYGPYFYTQAQIRDLVVYGQARHITIMPEIEMPGHLLGVLTAYPEYSCTGGPFEVRTRWGVEDDVLCIGNTNSLVFMEDILTEVLDLFPSRFIHIGGDEVPRGRWEKCRKCQALMKAEGLKTEAQLQTWFDQRIETFLSSKGRRLIGWDEILEGGLTPGAAVMSWRGIKGGMDAASAGHDVVMSPNSYLYLSRPQSKAPGEPVSARGYLPLEKVYSYEPVPAELPADKRRHILGAQAALWSEHFHEPTLKRFEYFAYPRACALAELTWSPMESRDFSSFSRRLSTHLQRLEALSVNFYRPTPAQAKAPKASNLPPATLSGGSNQ
jgi:hexosaminidase